MVADADKASIDTNKGIAGHTPFVPSALEHRNPSIAWWKENYLVPDWFWTLLEDAPPYAQHAAIDLLRFLRAPSDGRNLQLAVGAILDLFPQIEQIDDESGSEISSLPFIKSGCRIFAQRLKLEKLNLVFSNQKDYEELVKKGDPHDPMYGALSDYHLYSMSPYAFALDEGKKTIQDKRALAMSHVFYAAASSFDRKAGFARGAITRCEQAALGIRRLDSSYADRLPEDLFNHEEYLEHVSHLAESLSENQRWIDKNQHRYFNNFHALLRFSNGLIESTNPFIAGIPYCSSSEDEDGLTKLRAQNFVTIAREDVREAQIAGLAPSEIADPAHFYFLGGTEEDAEAEKHPVPETQKRTPSVFEQIMRRRGEIIAAERGAQMLRIAWSRLTVNEVALVLRQTSTLISTSDSNYAGRYFHDDPIGKEAAGVLITMLWMGKTIDETLELQLFRSREDLPPAEMLPGLGFVLETSEWCIPVVRPKGLRSSKRAESIIAKPTSPILLLPANFSTFHIRRLPQVSLAMRDGSAVAFGSDRIMLKDKLQIALNDLKRNSGGRITETAIKNTFYLQFIDLTRDLAAASIVFCRTGRMGDTQLHYANFKTDDLRNAYLKVCNAVQDQALNEIRERFPNNWGDPRTIKMPVLPDDSVGKQKETGPAYIERPYVGTLLTPTVDSVKRLISDIRAAFERSTKFYDDLDALIDYHDLITLYTVLMLKHATGYRDVRKPLPLHDNIDLDDKTILVSDKDDKVEPNARTLPLAETFIHQLSAYREHISWLIPRALLINPKLAKEIFIRAHEITVAPGDMELPILFFTDNLAGSLRSSTVSSKTIIQRLAKYAPWFTLPTNSNRSYLRDRLLMLGCPADFVDYFMGHWVRGKEPLGIYSTLSLDAYLNALRSPLEIILKEDGWEVIGSVN